jgi:uroporphyrinogen decarboxylase
MDYMYSPMGLELFSTLMYNEPDLLEEWWDAFHQAELRRVHAIADPKLIPVALTHDDMASKNGPIFNPEWLRKYEFPRLKALVEAWHSHDTICLFHSDGNLMPVLDDLVGAGIDGLNPLETLAGMSIREVRQRYGNKLFLTGGIDVSQLLSNGTPEEVRARCMEAIEESDGGRGYFLGSTTEILPTVPVENGVTMLELPKELAKHGK